MIRLYSTEQALALRGTIPELTITRSLQFQSDGYDSEEHGHIIVIQEGDDISRVTEIGPEGLFDSDGVPTYEYIEAFTEDGRVVYEAHWGRIKLSTCNQKKYRLKRDPFSTYKFIFDAKIKYITIYSAKRTP